MEFTGTIEPPRPGGTGGGAVVRLPDDVAASFGTRRQVRVKGTINGAAYRSNLMPLGNGAFRLGVHKATREAAGVTFGDAVVVTIERDDEPREVVVPPELQEALDKDPRAKQAFDALAPSHRREHANAVADAKKPDTRQRRVERTIAGLRGDG
jgi:hypothetical protein